MKKYSFTLAETLITLAIIGIISALTIPNLYVKYEKHQTAIHLKKVYSLLKQATEMSIRENGPLEEWDFNLSRDEFTKKYFSPYLKIEFKNQSFTGGVWYLTTSNERRGYLSYPPAFILADGTYVFYMFNSPYQVKHHLVIDLNGAKKPNKWGRDAFYFSFYNNSLVTFTSYLNIFNRAMCAGPGTSGQCNRTAPTGGLYCSRLIELDGWEIKDDYPW